MLGKLGQQHCLIAAHQINNTGRDIRGIEQLIKVARQQAKCLAGHSHHPVPQRNQWRDQRYQTEQARPFRTANAHQTQRLVQGERKAADGWRMDTPLELIRPSAIAEQAGNGRLNLSCGLIRR